ncbi:RNA polymerase sigma factor [Gracilimonas mengyeensis]|uniref:RNA polymerase sigma factor, sigma-70 family n=1 Tax=Gracilimonas mengyeensis TaxID=1302730 RepID=A0A521DEK6_9BACT|nr:sigma-70 family RNA polymerase sigma factor [Gracilimonas mengyeensis]SMO70129.1 RNA polymerase sigma factor, sigma-70 family [Gracilimonas mengyeensis]
MDYSKFVDAVLEKDDAEISRQVKVITAVLIKFLTVRMDAPLEDAQDCAQNTLLIGIEKIRNDEIDHPDALINYLFTTAKYEYLKRVNKKREVPYDELPEHHSDSPDQLNRLLDKEKMTLLKRCMEALKSDYQKYIEYWFQHPGYETSVVADYFNISVSNAWTKKHRVINLLKECVEKKIQK